MWPARPSMKARLNLPAAGWLNPGSGVGYGFFKGFFGSLLSWRWILRWLYQSEKACRTSLIFHFSFRVLHKRTFIIEFFRCLGNTLPLAGLWLFLGGTITHFVPVAAANTCKDRGTGCEG